MTRRMRVLPAARYPTALVRAPLSKLPCRCALPTLESARANYDQLVQLNRMCPTHGRKGNPKLWVYESGRTWTCTVRLWYGYERLTLKE